MNKLRKKSMSPSSNVPAKPTKTPKALFSLKPPTQPMPLEEYRLVTGTSLGDLIMIKSVLDARKAQYREIRVCPWLKFTKEFRYGNQSSIDFVTKIAELFYANEPPYVLDWTLPFEYFQYTSGLIRHDFRLVMPNKNYFRSKFCLLNFTPPFERYMVLTTKVRNYSVELWHRNRDSVLQAVRGAVTEAGLSVVILGERELGKNMEYLSGKNVAFIHCIYDDLKRAFPSALDLTVPELGVSSNPWPVFQRDCSIMARAQSTFCVGIGGNFILALSVGEPVVFYYPQWKTGAFDVYLQLGIKAAREPVNLKALLAKSKEFK
jgi:hypothetical protein